MSMVERVARAIARDDYDGDDLWDELGPGNKASYMANARAAIETMREPTDAMVDAMNEHAGSSAPEYSYRDAIDAALME